MGLPDGTVTFLFTDVEGSTSLLGELGAAGYAEALAGHRRVLRGAFAAEAGVEVDTQGDAFFVAFPTAPGALRAAAVAQAGFAAGPVRVRMGIHTGTPLVAEEGYVGVDVNRAARIAACGHGGQVLVSASAAALLDPAELHDLGEHRLKDLSAPERIYQLGPETFPPLRSLYRTNMPIPATPFLGREHELADVVALLAREDARLLTLTGPGGTGKTRLGLQAAAEGADRQPDGVFWVPLAALRDPELVLAAAAQALGAKDSLAEHIGDKSLLLFFDNFEHVVGAAGGLSQLLAACPNLQLLVTSRELLRVPGEQAYPVPPLEPGDGTELFLARARAARPDFGADEAVTELCARLEQLPLALELAAARVRVLSPRQLLERLSGRLDLLKAGRGVDARQQTLRATIEWSYELLDTGEQQLFSQLAVFAGGCTLEAAEEVCEADLDTLQSLVDKSLVRVREGDRFWMLETIREYASERLEQSAGADELRRRHAEHFLALAEEAEPGVRIYAPESLERLEREHDNVRAALDWLGTAGETQLVLRLAGSVEPFWFARGHFREGRRRLEAALRADARPTSARAWALTRAVELPGEGGDLAASNRPQIEEALALQREFGDLRGIAEATAALGYAVADGEGEWVQARALFEEAIRVAHEAGDEQLVLWVTRSLAWTYHSMGDRERARELHEENLARARVLGSDRVTATTLGALAIVAVDEGRLDDAFAMLDEGLRIDRDLGDEIRIAIDFVRYAAAHAHAGNAVTATRLVACYETLSEKLGAALTWVAKINEETLAIVRAQLDETAFAEAWEEGQALTISEAIELVLG